jgi:fructose-1-phosphate kinase PfkB-like protein
VRQVSPTGSGDVMLAGVLFARLHHGMSWRDAVAWSLPYAAANAAHPGVAEFPLPTVR